MTRDEFIEKFRFLKSWGFGTKGAIERLGKRYDAGLSYGQLLSIARTPSPEQVAKVVQKYNLCCPRCGTSEFIVGEAVGEIDGEVINRGLDTEYYCANKTSDGSVFSRCFYHFKLERPHTRKVKQCTA